MNGYYKDNKELIEGLKNQGVLRSKNIEKALLAVDRADFVPDEQKDQSYVDTPLPIGAGQTISQPYTVVFMLEKLDVHHGMKVLDVGFGSGWTTTLLGSIVGENGEVFGLEIKKDLYDQGKANIQNQELDNIELKHGSGWNGWVKKSPFDRILVSATADEVPKKLTEQLRARGKMVVPVKNFKDFAFADHEIQVISKDKRGKITTKSHPGFAFVPLVK